MDTEITKAQYEAIQKQISITQDTLDRRFAEWSDDRKNITDLIVEVKTVMAKIDAARDDINDGTEKTLHRIDEHLQPVPDITADAVHKAINNVKNKKWYNIFLKKGE